MTILHDVRGKKPFTMSTLPEEERVSLEKRLAKKHARLVEVYYVRTLSFSPGYFRAVVVMDDGEIQHWWRSHPNSETPRWRWDGVRGKRELEAYLAEHTDWSEYDQNGGNRNSNK